MDQPTEALHHPHRFLSAVLFIMHNVLNFFIIYFLAHKIYFEKHVVEIYNLIIDYITFKYNIIYIYYNIKYYTNQIIKNYIYIYI